VPESSRHMALVQRAAAYLLDRFPVDDGHLIFIDAPDTRRGDRPPSFEGYIPDVFLTDVPTRFNAIGEAKTMSDLENEHTDAQLDAFLRHLRIRTGILVVAVPWIAERSARTMVGASVRRTQATSVETVILTDRAPCR
jgi:hypothetical protein